MGTYDCYRLRMVIAQPFQGVAQIWVADGIGVIRVAAQEGGREKGRSDLKRFTK